MFEAKLQKADTLKRIIEAIKDLVKEAPFECSEGAIALQVWRSSLNVKFRRWIHRTSLWWR